MISQIVRELMQKLRECGVALTIARVLYRGARRVVDRLSSRFWSRRFASCGSGLYVQAGAQIEQPNRVSVGCDCVIQRGTKIYSEGSVGRLRLGSNVQVNARVRLDHTGDLTIGDGTLISEDVAVFTHSHGLDPRSAPDALQKSIGRDVWIGARAMVLEKCRHVGDRAIVAAGAVVTKDVPTNCVAYGNPCRMVPRKDGLHVVAESPKSNKDSEVQNRVVAQDSRDLPQEE